MDLNTVLWVTFDDLTLCRLIYRLSNVKKKVINTYESISMYPVDTRARGTGTT
jgi:hypothetical protein